MTRTFILLLIALVSARAHPAQWELLPDTDSTRASRLASDGIRLYAASYRHGLYISEDDGATWRHTGLPSARAIGISDDAVYVFCDRLLGMFRSDDRGESWAPKNVGLAEPDEDNLVEGDITHPRARQILVTESRMVIAVGYPGTRISRDRGETWHYPLDEWVWVQEPEFNRKHHLPPLTEYVALHAYAMVEFGGYLWVSLGAGFPTLFRSPDDGDTWERIPNWATPRLALSEYGATRDWAVRDNQLYVGGEYGFARWNEAALGWDDLSLGLTEKPYINALALNRGRFFAALGDDGVWMYDDPSETWIPVGLQSLDIHDLVSHQGYLYAAAGRVAFRLEHPDRPAGIYRAAIPIVNSYNKAVATWGALKRP